MKWILIICSLMLALDSRALITNNLAADWQAGVGVTVVAGRISQWNDQHNLLNNDGITNNLTQSNTNFQPDDTIDAHGFHGVMFPWAFGGQHPNDYLTIPNSLSGLSTTNLTVYAVATGPFDQEQSETLVYFAGAPGWISFFLDGTYPVYFPAGLAVGTRSSFHPVVYPPLNPAVFVGCGDGIKTTIRWNNVTQTNLPQSVATLSSGGAVGANTSAVSGQSEYGFCGIAYRILVYKQAHTTAQINAQVAELASLYNVRTNFTKQVVCRGDSIVEGVGSTNLQNFPFQLWERYPEIKWYDQGIGALLIGNSGTAGSMYVIDGNFVDPLYDSTLQRNWLFFFGGVNDINDGISATATYGRLTNYVAARHAAHPWQVVVSTVHSDVINPGSNAVYNACIRTNAGGWDRYVDPGVNSPIETRLNNPTNLTYFYTDGLHLVNAGYGVLADHYGQIINVPHRSTGFFGP